MMFLPPCSVSPYDPFLHMSSDLCNIAEYSPANLLVGKSLTGFDLVNIPPLLEHAALRLQV